MTAEVQDVTDKSDLAGQVLAIIGASSELAPVPPSTPWRIRVSRTNPAAVFEMDLTDDEMVEVTAGVADVLSERFGFPPTVHKKQGY